jgi:hypothetical protein
MDHSTVGWRPPALPLPSPGPRSRPPRPPDALDFGLNPGGAPQKGGNAAPVPEHDVSHQLAVAVTGRAEVDVMALTRPALGETVPIPSGIRL